MSPAKIYLLQTDTTAGFLSQDKDKLSHVKQREKNKKFIISVDSFKTLKKFTKIPQIHKKMIRRSVKTTFVYPNNLAIRVVKNKEHLKFLQKIKWVYSTSSNKAGEGFCSSFAKTKADVILYNKFGFTQKTSSKIIKCGRISKRRLR